MATKKSATNFVGVDAIKHADDKRKNIPTAEYQSLMADEARKPVQVTYPRSTSNADHLKTEKEARNHDLDPQLVWRGKDAHDWTDLVVNAPPLYIQEKVHPKVLIDDLLRQSRERREAAEAAASGTPDMFGDFNGIPAGADKTDFYAHDQNWTNRMILGDSLQVMASLAEREGLRGKVQCVYLDPPYGIKFNSNFQWSTTSRDVKDGNRDHISREPEQVKAFRDTWRDGINSYLTYLRDRLTVARDLLNDSGSVFVQIGDENVHRVRALMDEVFGDENCVALITIEKTSSQTQDYLAPVTDSIVWYAKSRAGMKFRDAWLPKVRDQAGFAEYSRIQQSDYTRRSMTREERDDPSLVPEGAKIYRQDNLTSQSLGREKGEGAASWFPVAIEGREFRPSITNRWKTNEQGMRRLGAALRLEARGTSLAYVRFIDDFAAVSVNNIWSDVKFSSRSEDKSYIVQTSARTVQRCMLMTTDPGDLVIDPTCGSGTTAYVAEQWGRRWITIDTSRVALALARARIMGARYPYYLLADSPEGQLKEAEITRGVPSSQHTRGNIRQGFVYERVPHVTLKSIANNAEIDVIWDTWQKKLEPLRETLNAALKKDWQDWEIPREADAKWNDKAKKLHADWWAARIERQREIDASIAAKAESEYLYDKPYECPRRSNFDPPCRLNFDPGLVAGIA